MLKAKSSSVPGKVFIQPGGQSRRAVDFCYAGGHAKRETREKVVVRFQTPAFPRPGNRSIGMEVGA